MPIPRRRLGRPRTRTDAVRRPALAKRRAYSPAHSSAAHVISRTRMGEDADALHHIVARGETYCVGVDPEIRENVRVDTNPKYTHTEVMMVVGAMNSRRC